jgi:hypothetical protein
MKKSKKHVQFHSAKWFWPSIFAHDDEASTRHSKAQEQASSAAWCSLGYMTLAKKKQSHFQVLSNYLFPKLPINYEH